MGSVAGGGGLDEKLLIKVRHVGSHFWERGEKNLEPGGGGGRGVPGGGIGLPASSYEGDGDCGSLPSSSSWSAYLPSGLPSSAGSL